MVSGSHAGDQRLHSYERARLKPWFTSDNRDPGSFKWICDHLELDSSRLRRRIFAIIDAPVSKHLHSTLARVSAVNVPRLTSAISQKSQLVDPPLTG